MTESNAKMTPGEAARNSFVHGTDRTPWCDLTDSEKEEWKNLAEAAIAVQPKPGAAAELTAVKLNTKLCNDLNLWVQRNVAALGIIYQRILEAGGIHADDLAILKVLLPDSWEVWLETSREKANE